MIVSFCIANKAITKQKQRLRNHYVATKLNKREGGGGSLSCLRNIIIYMLYIKFNHLEDINKTNK